MSEAPAVVKNAADPKQVNAAGSKVKQRERAAQERIKIATSTRETRRYLYDLVIISGFLQVSWSNEDTLQKREGARLIGQQIFNDVNALGPDLWCQMVKEAKEDLERGL